MNQGPLSGNLPPTHGQHHQVKVETITRLLRRNAKPVIRKILDKSHPADIQQMLEESPEGYIFAIYKEIPKPEDAATVLARINPAIRDLILKEINLYDLEQIMDEFPPDDLTDFIGELAPEQAEQIMSVLGQKEKSEVENLLQYDPNSAGGIMNSDFFSLKSTVTVGEAVERLRIYADVELVFYLYVMDEEGRMAGVISLRNLLLAKANACLSEVMETNIIMVDVKTDPRRVADLTDKYRLLAIPVVDDDKKLVGVITVDDVLDLIEEQHTDVMLRMAGTGEAEVHTQSAFKIAWIRLPWLLTAFLGGLAATGIIHHFEGLLGQYLALGTFLPVVMGMAGNVGVQAATVAVRGLATGSLNMLRVGHVLYKEVRVGLILGLFYGVALSLFGTLVFGNTALGQVVGLTILINMVGASLLAIGLPIFFHRVGIDPAIATGPFVTTAIDIFGVLNFFMIATQILPPL